VTGTPPPTIFGVETFVVRIWHPAGSEREPIPEPARLRGIVEHVATGRADTFAGPVALVALLLSAVAAAPLTTTGEPALRPERDRR
jgi:hypothetical protein